jgi:LPXTG-motif cell wall-anchored protein
MEKAFLYVIIGLVLLAVLIIGITKRRARNIEEE